MPGKPERQSVPARKPCQRSAPDPVAQDAPGGAGIGCIEDAYAAGFRVYISLQFNNHLTPSQVAAYVREVLPAYAPYVWALGVGNEQDLSMPSTYGQGTVSLTGTGEPRDRTTARCGTRSSRYWRSSSRSAIRVYGEFSPWGFGATEQGFEHGRPPGVQAIAAHCYHTKLDGLLQIPQDAAWSASKRTSAVVLGDGPRLASPDDAQVDRARLVGVVERAVGRVVAREPRSEDVGLLLRPRAVGTPRCRRAPAPRTSGRGQLGQNVAHDHLP